MTRGIHTGVAVAALLLAAGGAVAAGSAADKCEAAKNKIAGAYYACREKAEATAIAKAAAPDYSKCTAKFDGKWDGAETGGSGMCPDNVLTPAMNSYLTAQAASAALIISGTDNIPTCGDGEINAAGELCDGAALGGKTCSSLGYRDGTLACTAGCNFDAAGCDMCPGFEYQGDCWFLGAVDESCIATCLAAGMVYDAATEDSAGVSGTDAYCDAVLTGLGAPGSGIGYSGNCASLSVDCYYDTAVMFRVRCSSPASAPSNAYPDGRRACACY